MALTDPWVTGANQHFGCCARYAQWSAALIAAILIAGQPRRQKIFQFSGVIKFRLHGTRQQVYPAIESAGRYHFNGRTGVRRMAAGRRQRRSRRIPARRNWFGIGWWWKWRTRSGSTSSSRFHSLHSPQPRQDPWAGVGGGDVFSNRPAPARTAACRSRRLARSIFADEADAIEDPVMRGIYLCVAETGEAREDHRRRGALRGGAGESELERGGKWPSCAATWMEFSSTWTSSTPVDVEGVEPMAQVLFAGEADPLREDIPQPPPLGNEAALANAPQSGAGYFKVPQVIER